MTTSVRVATRRVAPNGRPAETRFPALGRPHAGRSRPVTPRAASRPRGRTPQLVLPVLAGSPCVHPVQPPSRGRGLVATAVVAFLSVCGLVLLGGQAQPGEPVPEATTVVVVGAGETIWQVARRLAPESQPGAVVQRIRELNQLPGSALQPGQPLRVPDGG